MWGALSDERRKLQRGLSSMETWCGRWNLKINEDKTWRDLLLS
jgi:hypothetical protein